MTLKRFLEYYQGMGEFAYFDDKYSINIFPDSGESVICTDCPSDTNEDFIKYSSIEEAIENFMVNGKPFHEVIVELDENLL